MVTDGEMHFCIFWVPQSLGYICISTRFFGFALLRWNVLYFPFRANKSAWGLKSQENHFLPNYPLNWLEMKCQLKNATAEHGASRWQHHEQNSQSCCSFLYFSPSIFFTCVPTRQWMWKGKIKSRPSSVVTSDSGPRKQNLFLNLTFTLASHASCTSCSVLVVVDSS